MRTIFGMTVTISQIITKPKKLSRSKADLYNKKNAIRKDGVLFCVDNREERIDNRKGVRIADGLKIARDGIYTDIL